MEITILDWNVWSDNENVDEVVDFINNQKADIVCLQEVPIAIYNKLSRLPSYFVMRALDSIYRGKKCFLVMLVRHPLVVSENSFGSHKFKKKGIGTLFAKIARWEEGQEFQYVDINFSHQKEDDGYHDSVRFFNVHLDSAVGPRSRLKLFNQVLEKCNLGSKNIICGDLNVLRTGSFGKFYTWVTMAYRIILLVWSEILIKEHEIFEEAFKDRGLTNIFKGYVTHKNTDYQLDYILLPPGVEAVKKKMHKEMYESDHPALRARLKLFKKLA